MQRDHPRVQRSHGAVVSGAQLDAFGGVERRWQSELFDDIQALVTQELGPLVVLGVAARNALGGLAVNVPNC